MFLTKNNSFDCANSGSHFDKHKQKGYLEMDLATKKRRRTH